MKAQEFQLIGIAVKYIPATSFKPTRLSCYTAAGERRIYSWGTWGSFDGDYPYELAARKFAGEVFGEDSGKISLSEGVYLGLPDVTWAFKAWVERGR